MATFTHEVPADIRAASRWDPDYACFVAPDGRAWVYTDDPRQETLSWRDSSGAEISVAIWLDEETA